MAPKIHQLFHGRKKGGASYIPCYLQSPCANEGISGFTFHNAAQTVPFPNTNCSKLRQWESVTHRRRQTAGQVSGPKSKNVDIMYKCFRCILILHKDQHAKSNRMLRIVARLCQKRKEIEDKIEARD